MSEYLSIDQLINALAAKRAEYGNIPVLVSADGTDDEFLRPIGDIFAININDKKYFHFHGYATDEIKETFAKTISYCILEDNKHEGDFEHMWNFIARHMITHIDTFYSINNKEDK